MASIQSLGIGSGLLTSDLIDKIVSSERNATDARMTAKKAEIDAKVSAFGAVKNHSRCVAHQGEGARRRIQRC